MEIKRGQIYYADLSPVKGSEQGGLRPVIIIQNDRGNKFSPTVIIAPITSKVSVKAKLPTHIDLNIECGLKLKSMALLEQIRVIDKLRLREKVGEVSLHTMNKIDFGIKISLGIN